MNAFLFISRIYEIRIFLLSLYLLICTPTFAISSHVVFIFYIMANLGRGILNGKKSAYVEILFYLCALKCIQRYIQNCVVDGFLFGEKVHNQPFVLEILLRTMV